MPIDIKNKTTFANPLYIKQIFGAKAFHQLQGFMDACCSITDINCLKIKECLGISPDGDPTLVLNQLGNWITNGGSGGSPSAPVNSIQYNNAGAFFGDSDFTRDPTNHTTQIYARTAPTAGVFLQVAPTTGQFSHISSLISRVSGFNFTTSDVTVRHADTTHDLRLTINSSNIRLGDTSGTFGNTVLTIDDSANTLSFSGPLFPSLFIDSGISSKVSLGDYTNFYQHTSLTLDDDTGAVTVNAGTPGTSGFFVKDSNGDHFLKVETGNAVHSVQLGDVDNAHNKTFITIDDITLAVQISAVNSFNVVNPTDGGAWLQVNPGSRIVVVGDGSPVGNSTRLIVDDGAENIEAVTNGRFIVRTPTGGKVANIGTLFSANFGDLDATANSTRFTLSDASETVRIWLDQVFSVNDTAGNEWIKADINGKVVSIGDTSGSGYTTRISVDDSNRTTFFETGMRLRRTAVNDSDLAISNMGFAIITATNLTVDRNWTLPVIGALANQAPEGYMLVIKNKADNTSDIILDTPGAETIDNSAAPITLTPGQSITLISDGVSDYEII